MNAIKVNAYYFEILTLLTGWITNRSHLIESTDVGYLIELTRWYQEISHNILLAYRCMIFIA